MTDSGSRSTSLVHPGTASASPVALTKAKLLIGEGVEEVRFFGALLKHLNLGTIHVESYQGGAKLSPYLKGLRGRTGFGGLRSLGVTRDADRDASAASESIRTALANNAFVVPGPPSDTNAAGLKVSIFVLPGGGDPGMLEDLCLRALQDGPEMPCVDDYFKCLRERTARAPQAISKACIHAWLAAQTVPDRRLGEAAESDDWPWTAPAFAELKKFVTDL